MSNNPETESAVALFTEQRDKLAEIRNLDYRHPDFKLWQDTSINSLLKKAHSTATLI
jgi:hypothetical protein